MRSRRAEGIGAGSFGGGGGAEETEYLDTQEQEEVIRELERSHARQSLAWRAAFAAGAVAGALLFSRAALSQHRHPWHVHRHALFYGELSSTTVIAADMLACTALCIAAIALFVSPASTTSSSSSSQVGFLPLPLAAVTLAFWAWHSSRVVVGREQWLHAMWAPAAAFGYVAACWYCASVMADTRHGISKLRAYKYQFKAA
eukprot:jgi/Chlat1/4980/Chrsp32S04965